MRFTWSGESIQWFLDASTYTGFHSILAQKIAPWLEPGYSLCDIGCGLGRIDLELASYVRKLTALDINSDVTGILKADAQKQKLHHISVICKNVTAFEGQFDVVLMSFFGKSEKDMSHYFHLCRKKMIRIVNVENKSSLYPGRHRRTKKDTASIVSQELAEQGFSYHLDTESIEFGQPFRTKAAAESFVRFHAPEIMGQELEKFLQEHLEQTGRSDFPFYLPNQKTLGIFVIDKEG